MAPVVEGGQLADHGHEGVGLAEIVLGDAREVLHLPHDVIAQVSDQAGVQRRQVRQLRRLERLEDRLERRQDAGLACHTAGGRGVEIERAGGADGAPHGPDDGQRVAADERVPPPALASFHRFEQEPVPVPHDPQEGADRGQRVRNQFAPYRDDAMLGRQDAELIAPRATRRHGRDGRWTRARPPPTHRRHGRSRCARRCGMRQRLPGRPRPATCRRHSRS